METQIRKVGNSKGIIIPKSMIEKYHLIDRVIITEENNCIIIKPIHIKTDEVDKIMMLKAKSKQLAQEMKKDASNKMVQEYYNKIAFENEIDLDIL